MDPGGGAILVQGGTLDLTDDVITGSYVQAGAGGDGANRGNGGNAGSAGGGAVYVATGATLNADQLTVQNSYVSASDAPIVWNHCNLEEITGGCGGYYGGKGGDGGTAQGGGVYVAGTLNIVGAATFSGDQAVSAGGPGGDNPTGRGGVGGAAGTAEGGAIYVASGGSLNQCASPAFSNNSVTATSGPGGNEGEGATDPGPNGAAGVASAPDVYPAGATSTSHTCRPLQVVIGFPEPSGGNPPSYSIGKPFPVTITVSTTAGPVTNIQFNGLPLTFVPSDAVRVLSTTKVAPFTLPAGASKTFSFQLNPLEPAAATAITSVSGQLNGATVTAQDRGAFSVIGTGPLLVALTVDPGKIKVQQTADGVDPIEATVTAAVTNTTNKRIDAVTIDKELSIAVLDHYHVPAVPLKQVNGPTPSAAIGTLSPGATKKVTYQLEVSGDGHYSLVAIARGTLRGAVVTGVGRAQVAPESQLLVWSAALGRRVRIAGVRAGSTVVPGGTAFTISIKLEDRSYTSALVIAPMWPKSMSGNASDGHVQTPSLPIEALGQSAPPPSPFYELEPRQTKTVEMVIQTAKSDAKFIPELISLGEKASPRGGTRATVTLPDYWGGWVVSDQDDHVLGNSLTADDELFASASTAFNVSVGDSALDRQQLSAADATYLAVGEVALAVPYAAKELITGTWNLVSETIPAALSAAYLGATEILSYEVGLVQGLDADPQARASFITQVSDAVSSAYAHVTNIPALVKQDQILVDKIDKVVFGHYAAIEQELYDGDYDSAVKSLAQEGVTAVASIPGAPEATLGAAEQFVDLTSIAAARLVRLDDAAALLEAAQAAVKDKLAAWIGTATEEAANPITDAINFKNFPRRFLGIPIDVGAVPALFGYSAQQLQQLLAFCKDNDVIVTIRGRAQAALGWLNAPGGAALKPEAFKLKTVDAIDEAFLGYAPPPGQQTLASLVVRVPPSEQEVITRLRAAGVPEGSPDWQAALQRLADRQKEFSSTQQGYAQSMLKWNDQGKVTTKWNWVDNEIPKANEPETVNFRLVDLSDGKRLPKGSAPRPGANYAVEVQALNESGGPVGNWQRVTGDADMVAIVNPDGSGLTQPQHIKLLNQLRDSNLGVAHPELATWTRYDEANPFFFASKEKQLQSGTFLQACPDATLRAVQYAPALTNLTRPGINTYNYFIRFVGGCESPLSGLSPSGLPLGGTVL